MKVLYTLGVIPHYYAKLLNKLQSMNIDVVVVSTHDASLTLGKGVKANEERIDFKIIYSDERLAFYKKAFFPNLSEILKTEKPDIIVTGWPYFIHYFFSRTLRNTIKQLGIKFVIREIPFQTPPFGKMKEYYRQHPVHTENMDLLSRGIGFRIRAFVTMYIRRYCYRRATATLNYCSAAYDIIPTYGISRDKVFVTYNATDNESLWREREKIMKSPSLLPPGRKRILHIGRLVKWKRVDLLFSAFAKIKDKYPDTDLIVVGDGPEKENLIEQSENLHISDRIMFVGGIYDSYNLGKYMNEADIYVLAGMGGLSVNDAMAYGLPVVCSVCDGTEKDLITDGVNGYFFREGDADSLAEKIELLLSDEKRSKEMGEESYRVIRDKINCESVSKLYVNAFEQIINFK